MERAPRFSVIVPTRDRPETLPFALRSCLEQLGFDDYEVIVCDNSRGPATREVVAPFLEDRRARYVRAPRDLSMASNWELALSHARGEFVLFIGDDDALLAHALFEVDRILRETEATALRWDYAYYCWPNVPQAEDRDFLVVPLTRTLQRHHSRTRMLEVARRATDYPLPVVYHGVVRRALLERIRVARGRFFEGTYPDVYSGFVVGAHSEMFWSTSVPMSVAGLSGKSTGVAVLFEEAAPVAADFTALNASDQLFHHPWVADVGTFAAAVLDSFLMARDRHFPDDPSLAIDRRFVVTRLLESISGLSLERRRSQEARLRSTLTSSDDLRWFDEVVGGERPGGPPRSLTTRRLGCDGDALSLNAARFGASDVHAAARLVCQLLSLDPAGSSFDLPSRAAVLEEERQKRARVEAELTAYQRSASWRVTAPLRRVGSLLGSIGASLRGDVAPGHQKTS